MHHSKFISHCVDDGAQNVIQVTVEDKRDQ